MPVPAPITPGTPAAGKLGAFAGVFTPSVLTILGLILFLRLGYVVGNAGLLESIAILAIATAISLITSLSLSAIATNITVKKGGDYYLISRTLGPAFGGAIGAVLFLAQAISVAFYCVGFGEAAAAIIGLDHARAPQVLAAAAVAVLFLFAWAGADWASKLQMLIMGILIAALASLTLGAIGAFSPDNLAAATSPFEKSPGFWVLFAVFFPAVTGFTQGVSMSGDLKSPGRAIPVGILSAVGVSTFVYLGLIVLLAGAVSPEALATDLGASRRLSSVGWLFDAGVIAATISSGMASFLGAPRILQSLAQDRIVLALTPFAKGVGPSENPRRATVLTFALAIAVVALGNLNLIAGLVSMFFLVSYGLLNYATYYEARSKSPSFRPRFRFFNAHLSLLGAIGCAGVMVAIDFASGLVALVILFGLFEFLRRTVGPVGWADSSRSYHLHEVRNHLLEIAADPEHARDWRPHILAFSASSVRRESLLRLASWISAGAGFTTAVKFIQGEGPRVRRERAEAEAELAKELKVGDYGAFPLVIAGPEILAAARVMLQSYGVGPLRANTILLNWLEQAEWNRDEEAERRYGSALRAALRLGKHVLVLEAEAEEWERMVATPRKDRRIDIWWFNDDSSRLLLLIGYLMTRSEQWEDASLRVLAATKPDESEDDARERLESFLDEARIDAEALSVHTESAEAIVQHSADATLVLCPFRIRHDLPCDPFAGLVEDLVSRLPVTILGIAADEIDLSPEPDEGIAAEEREAVEKARKAESVARRAEEEAEEAAMQADREITERFQEFMAQRTSANQDAGFREQVERLREEASRSARRAAKARAKADIARKEAGVADEPAPADSQT